MRSRPKVKLLLDPPVAMSGDRVREALLEQGRSLRQALVGRGAAGPFR